MSSIPGESSGSFSGTAENPNLENIENIPEPTPEQTIEMGRYALEATDASKETFNEGYLENSANTPGMTDAMFENSAFTEAVKNAVDDFLAKEDQEAQSTTGGLDADEISAMTDLYARQTAPEPAGNYETTETLTPQEKIPYHQGWNGVIKKAMIPLVVGIAGATISLAGCSNAEQASSSEQATEESIEDQDQDMSDRIIPEIDLSDIRNEIGGPLLKNETLEYELGINYFAGDKNVGCYEGAKEKVTPNSVGNPNEVLELMGIDPAKATAEDYALVTQYMEYSMKYPAAANAVIFGLPGFEDFELSDAGIRSAEAKIDDMDDQERGEFIKDLYTLNQKAGYSLVTAEGKYKDQGVEEKDGKRYSRFYDVELGPDVLLLQKEVEQDDGSKIIVFYKTDCANLLYIFKTTSPSGEEKTTIVTITIKDDEPTPSTNPHNPTNPTTPTNPDPGNGGDAKNPEAIEKNMQTGDETNNYVTPQGSGPVTPRPDTSANSYKQEQEQQSQAKEQAKSAPSGSQNGGTVGDAIKQADQTYADHTNYTPAQQAEQQKQAQAQEAQNRANEAETPVNVEAETKSDAEMADWFNSITR